MNYSTITMEDYKQKTNIHDEEKLQAIVNNIQSSNVNVKELTDFAQNKIINNDDGLTLAEVLQVLIQMLNGDLDLLKKVLMYAGTMVKHGMRIPKESQLTKSIVRQTLQGRKSSITQDSLKISPTVPNMKTTKKRERGV